MHRTRIDPDRLVDFTRAAARACGAGEDAAQALADGLVWCDLVGRDEQGVCRLPTLCKRLTLGLINGDPSPAFNRQGAAVGVLDGDGGSGYQIGRRAMDHAIEIAGETGAGAVAVRNSNHFGAAAYFVQLAAAEQMIGVAMSNSTPKVAPFGGRRRVFGTNPFAFAAPRRDGRSVLLDMSTSAISGSRLRACAEEGRSLPAGVAIDGDGVPTIDARQVEEGFGALLPFGGAKGYGLALMVEILCGVVAGAGISEGVAAMYHDFEAGQDNGHFVVAIDIDRFMPLDNYFDRMDYLAGIVTGGDNEPAGVRLPGQKRWRIHERRLREGIPISASRLQSLERLASECGVKPLT